MRTFSFVRIRFLFLSLLLPGAVGIAPLDTTREEARAAALATALIMDQEGYNLRDEYEIGLLVEGDSKVIRTQFYSTHDYVLVAGGCSDAYDVDLRVYDENGNLVAEDRESRKVAIVEVSPRWTGTFYVEIEMFDASRNGAHYAMVYGWK